MSTVNQNEKSSGRTVDMTHSVVTELLSSGSVIANRIAHQVAAADVPSGANIAAVRVFVPEIENLTDEDCWQKNFNVSFVSFPRNESEEKQRIGP